MAYNALFDNVSWTIDRAPESAHLDYTDPEDPANQAMLNSIAFDGAKSIILVANRWDHGMGPVIHIPDGATILQVLTAIADDYQIRPMTEDEIHMETEGGGLNPMWDKACKDYDEGRHVYRIDIMGWGVFFEGFCATDDPDVLRLSLGS
jgi:hypothetical protein